jgi:hypothetical protein
MTTRHSRDTTSRYGRGSHVITRFQQFLDKRNIPSARIETKLQERLEGIAPGRRKMARIRLDRTDPTRKDMVYILWAVREVAADPGLQMEDLFNLDANDPANWPQ